MSFIKRQIRNVKKDFAHRKKVRAIERESFREQQLKEAVKVGRARAKGASNPKKKKKGGFGFPDPKKLSEALS